MPVPFHIDTSLRRRLCKDEVFDRLFEAILDGTLSPGERLHDDELRRWLGVSRTPIRLALDRLEELRLVETRPNHYTRVSRAEPGRIPQIIEVMCGLWGLAVRRSLATLDDEELDACLSGLRRAALSCREAAASCGPSGATDFAEVVEVMRQALFFFSEHAGNELLRELVVKIGASLRFQLGLPGSAIDLSAFATVFDDLAAEVRARDVDAAVAIFSRLRDRMTAPRSSVAVTEAVA